MTLRWRLNLSVAAMVAVFLAASAFGMRAVVRHGTLTRLHARMREQSQFTADVRTYVYQQLSASAGLMRLPPELAEVDWPDFILKDIDVQIRLAQDDSERTLWTEVRNALVQLGTVQGGLPAGEGAAALDAAVHRLEIGLRRLRNHYDVKQHALVVSAAHSGLVEHLVLWIGCGLTVFLFLVLLILIRDWLVKPMEVLKAAANTIGRGRYDYRIPLNGKDELAGLARDIESMAQALAQRQSELVESREFSAIGELCANVAHGLRNPLAAIRATAQLAQRRLQGNDQAVSMMQDLAGLADRMDLRITRLFDFSKKVQLRPVATSFAELVDIADSRARPLLNTHQQKLLRDDQTGAETWLVDRDQVAEALAELISNASHHSPESSQIIVRGTQCPPANGSGPLLQIEVIDSGTGMDPITLSKAFDLFYTSRPNGTGLGLALVRRIVNKHGGELSITSSLELGTTVRVVLPSLGKLHRANAEPATEARAR